MTATHYLRFRFYATLLLELNTTSASVLTPAVNRSYLRHFCGALSQLSIQRVSVMLISLCSFWIAALPLVSRFGYWLPSPLPARTSSMFSSLAWMAENLRSCRRVLCRS